MKINLISAFNQPRLENESKIIEFSLRKLFKNININKVDYYKYNCPIADINIFIDTINDILTYKAKYNIYVVNHEYIYKNWVNSLIKFDKILVKSDYSKQLIDNYSSKVVNIGWSTKDTYNHNSDKCYNSFLYLNKSETNTKMLIEIWKDKYPKLYIINYNSNINKSNIEFLNVKDDNEVIKLINKYKIYIDLPETGGFSHDIEKALLCKSIIIAPNIPPINEIKNIRLVKYSKKNKINNYLVNKYKINEISLISTIEQVIDTPFTILETEGNTNRNLFLERTKIYELKFKKELDDIMKLSRKIDKITDDLLEDDKLPQVSIITPTYNHTNMVRLMMFNYNITNYPRDKLEWVIIDDGDTKLTEIPSETIRKKLNIKYISLDEKMNIGKKRNFGISKASYDIIIFMDDDDFYPPNSIKNRVTKLIKNKTECVGCTTLAYFHINKLISTIFLPTYSHSLENRVSEASLCFTRKFWEKRNFDNNSLSYEANEFLKGRNSEFLEITWEDTIIGLLHNNNITNRVNVGNEPNGCHFGWNDDLFLFITNLDKEQQSK